jgi:hypothetical protein
VQILATGSAGGRQLDLAANGNAVAVWVQSESNVSSIWASTYKPADGWGPATLLETSNLGDANAPQVKWDAAGNAMAIWQQYDGRFTSIYSARFTPAGGWGVPVLVEDLDIPNAGVPQIAFDPAGNATAVWTGQAAGTYSAWSNRYTPSNGWGTPALLETDDSSAVTGYIQVAMDADGNAFAVWSQNINSGNGSQSRIQANRFNASAGAWAGATLIENNVAGGFGGASAAQVAADASGHAVVVWRQNGNGPFSTVQANRYVPGSGWAAAQTQVEPADAAAAAGYSLTPQLALNADGHAVVVWSKNTATRENVLASSFSPTTGWLAAPVLLENQDLQDAQDPQVGLDALGNATAVWRQTAGPSEVNIWEARYTPAGGWAAARQTETGSTTTNAYEPTVRVAPNGTAVIGWRNFVSGVGSTQWTRFFQ